jgi:hypothetical protein
VVALLQASGSGSTFKLAVPEDLSGDVVDAWNAAFSALFVGAAVVLVALIVHISESPAM